MKTTNTLTRCFRTISNLWRGEERCWRRPRQTPLDRTVPAMVELLEPRKVLTTTVVSNTTPTAIPDNGPQVFSNINVVGITGAMTEINVRLNIEHLRDKDLTISLFAPSGKIFQLSTNYGGTGQNYFGTIFTSVPGWANISTGNAPFTGRFTPKDSLQSLIGTSPNGLWRLSVQDQVGGVAGTLDDWSLEITTAATFSNTTNYSIPDNSSVGVASPIVVSGLTGNVGELQVGLDIQHSFDADLDISLISPQGKILQLSNAHGGIGQNYTGTYFQTNTADPAIGSGAAPFTGLYSPDQTLSPSNIQGGSPNGTWQLFVKDHAALNTGKILDWSLSILTAPNFSAFQAGNTLIVTSPQPNYDQSKVTYQFDPTGLTLTTDHGTSVNGLFGNLPKFVGVTSILGLLGSGDDEVDLLGNGQLGATQGAMTFYMGGGNNGVLAQNMNSGPMVLEGTAGTVDLAANFDNFQSLTILGGQNDRITVSNSNVTGPAYFLLGGGYSQLNFLNNATLGSTFVSSSGHVDLTSDTATLAGITVIGGSGLDRVELQSSIINGATTLLLGGGANNVDANASQLSGFTFIESGAGVLTFTGNDTNFLNGLTVIGGTTQSDALDFLQCTFTGGETFLLGGNAGVPDSLSATFCTFGGSFLLSATGSVYVFVETNTPNFPVGTDFQGPASFFVGANSLLYFGHDPTPSEPTTFQAGLTIFAGSGSKLRRRMVTITGATTLSGTTEI